MFLAAAAVAGGVEAASAAEAVSVEAAASAVLAAAVPVGAGPAAVGSMGEDAMIPQKIIDEFVKRMQEAGGANIESIILFGSAVAGDFHPGLSNLNLLLRSARASFEALRALGPAAKWWDGQKHPPPLCMTASNCNDSSMCSPSNCSICSGIIVCCLVRMCLRVRIPMDLHRVQVEYELREKLVLLRQHVLLASENDSRLWDLLQRSVSSLRTLFRHALIALGRGRPPHAVKPCRFWRSA